MSDNSWCGTGKLPPVGIECIFDPKYVDDICEQEKFAIGQKVKIECHFNTGHTMVAGFSVFNEKEDFRVILQAAGICFSPIKTERERAIDDCIEIFNAGGANDGLLRSMAGSLYDAGYRKTHTPD